VLNVGGGQVTVGGIDMELITPTWDVDSATQRLPALTPPDIIWGSLVNPGMTLTLLVGNAAATASHNTVNI